MNFDNKAAVQAFLKASCEDLDTSVTSLYQNKMQPFRQTIEHLHEVTTGCLTVEETAPHYGI